DWEFLSVNHGSFGATPLVVLAAQADWRRRMEAQTGRFFGQVLPNALRHAADRLGAFIGAEGKDIAFVDNATTGCNAVLRSLRLQAGEEVVVLTHGYGAVRNTVRFVTERAGARMVEAAIPFPRPDPDAVVAAVQAVLTSHTRLALLDHITSGRALVLPVQRMVDACHAAGVPVLVDGAHAPAQVDLDLRALGADWYAGNCHKWLCAPKGASFLWAAPHRQHDLHPVTISHGFGQGFLHEFDWTGTRDPSPYLCVDTAIDFHARLGGGALRARNVALAAEATALLAGRLNTEAGGTSQMAGSMGVVRLPLPGSATAGHAGNLRQRLMAAGSDAPVHAIDGSLWLRISAFAYNEIGDYERLAALVAGVLR
ncbi:MAG TPA: aminotransferase class V-fold PLP-dependent enzyme, partial [Acetobacteraceae bacterium]|nr:aminotransferase class V-fold PLP-dependent enzyme [Acetobacteraceae bacterium]